MGWQQRSTFSVVLSIVVFFCKKLLEYKILDKVYNPLVDWRSCNLQTSVLVAYIMIVAYALIVAYVVIVADTILAC